MKKLIPLLFLFFAGLFNGQYILEQYSESNIYKLKVRLEKGDKKALYELTPYFDSHKKLVEFLGYHYLETEEFYLAKRAITENFIFPEEEIKIDGINNSKEYSKILTRLERNIKYLAELQTFYITPIHQRKEYVKFRELPKTKLKKLNSRLSEILSQDWIRETKIDLLITQNNPQSLLKICEKFYRSRDRFNYYSSHKEDYHDLLRILIGKDIGSVGKDSHLAWDTNDFNFDNNAVLNLLIYFSKNYKNFIWDDSEKHFINKSLKSQTTDYIAELFEELYSEDNSVALNSFIKLTQDNDSNRVNEICTEKEKNSSNETNPAIPLFPFKFLSQLSLFTQYCRENKIDFEGTKDLHLHIEKLSSDLSFRERREYENYLIDRLTLKDITPIEYWTLIYEKRPNLSESVSRILDIYYTRNWDEILNNEDQLKLYLKKSLLYDRIGINGNLNYYLFKFTGNSTKTINILNKIKSEDQDINFQIEKAKKKCLENFDYPINEEKINNTNFNSQKIDLKKEIEKIRITAKDNDDFEYKIVHLLSKVGYSQIEEAIRLLDTIKFDEKNYRNKYSFLERDFGFFLIKNWKDKNVRAEFLSVYNSHKEKELYMYYLDLAGVDYKNKDKSLNYDKIYEILKFNIVTPFTGNQELENEVGAIIKILELDQKTTLGYPDKLCNSGGSYICPPSGRAWEWRKYLKDKKLLKNEHLAIVSFNYGYYIDKVLVYKKISSK